MSPSDTPLSSTVATTLGLLSRLSRKGSGLHRAPEGDGFLLTGPGTATGKHDHRTRTYPASVVQHAISRGWLVEQGGRWRLSEEGALTLRRGLASVEMPRTAAAVSPAPPIRPAHTPRATRSRRIAILLGHQAEAAQRLEADFLAAQMVPRTTSNWDRLGSGVVDAGSRHPSGLGVEVSHRTASAQDRVRRALTDAGPEFAGLLLDLCCFDEGIEIVERKRGWPQRTAKVVLGLALDRLARHYGIVGQGPAHGPSRHWGTEDFRPGLEQWRR